MNKHSLSCLCIVLALALCLSLPVSARPVPEVLAFPHADGFGKYTVGGRGGRVIEVTTLEDGGGIPGSLRAAVEAECPRVVVFKVAGTIDLVSSLDIKNPYITIAGQTAPGQGITIKGYTFYIKTGQVIIRNLRFRLGDFREADAMDIASKTPFSHVILDHCSLSWGVDETLCIKNGDNITVQWCFITEGLHDSVHSYGKHSKGALVSGSHGQRVGFHNNLFAHHDARSPRPQGLLSPAEDDTGFFFDFTNNVVYDWGRSYAAKNLDKDQLCTANFINNYFIAGPSSKASNILVDKNPNFRFCLTGNYMNGNQPADEYKLVTYEDFVKPDGWKLDAPFDNWMTTVRPAEKAYSMVLAHAGASLRRDSCDDRIVREVLNGTGRIIDSPAEVGGWPMLETGEAYLDTDRDGTPDAWEIARGLNPNDPSDGPLDSDGDGYTNLEDFLNELMDPLYSEDVPFEPFNNSFRFFRFLGYTVLRWYRDARKWTVSLWDRLFA